MSASPAAPIVASNLRPIHKNSLIGVVDLTVPRWRIVFCGCTWHRRGEKEWVNFPGREWTDQAGTKHFANLITFTDEDSGRRFQGAALAAIHAIARGSNLEAAS
jgi:hypothetical protein